MVSVLAYGSMGPGSIPATGMKFFFLNVFDIFGL